MLSPTRELAIQTSNVVTSIGSMMNDLKVQAHYGGSHMEEANDFSNKKKRLTIRFFYVLIGKGSVGARQLLCTGFFYFPNNIFYN